MTLPAMDSKLLRDASLDEAEGNTFQKRSVSSPAPVTMVCAKTKT